MLELLHRLIHGIVRHMNIAIHGGLDACVPQQLLQNLRLHAAFDGAGGVCMAQGMHRETLDPGIVAKFIEVGVIAAVLGRLPGAPVDEDQIGQLQLLLLASLAVHVR